MTSHFIIDCPQVIVDSSAGINKKDSDISSKKELSRPVNLNPNRM